MVWKPDINVLLPLLISFVVLFILFLNNRSRFGVQQNTRLFIVVSDVFLFLSAVYCCYLNDIYNDKNYFGHYVSAKEQLWSGEILELPVEKENVYKAVISVRSMENAAATSGKAIVYFKKPFDKTLLQPGNLLSIKSVFHPVSEPLNPHEFNYKEFLARKNIHYTGFVEQEDVLVNGPASGFSFVRWGLNIKKAILEAFNDPVLEKNAAQLCAALLTGYDDEIDPATINSFAHSGTLHVLSVSGLHTGILYGTLIFILGLIDKHKKHKLVQLVIITIVLWAFVLITGFSPPVLRAAIMLNLIAVGRSYYTYAVSHSLNILAVSAFIILVFDPWLIMDTGFLLSYFAVAGILLFEPTITGLVESRHWIVNKIWQLTSVSLAAQISTLPITLFLFHQFPLWFVFSNLIVIPLCIVVMALAFLFLLKLSFLAPLINICSLFIFFIIHLTDTPGMGYIDHIDFGWTDLVCLSAVIITLALFVKTNSYSLAAATVSLLIIWQITSLFEVSSKKSSSHIAVYHVKRQSAIDLKNCGELVFMNGTDPNNYNYHIRNNQTFLNYPEYFEITADYIAGNDKRFFSVSSSEQVQLVRYLNADHILIRNNVELAAELLKDVKPKLIIADGSNNYSSVKKLKALCDKFAIPFHNTAKDGYLQIEI